MAAPPTYSSTPPAVLRNLDPNCEFTAGDPAIPHDLGVSTAPKEISELGDPVLTVNKRGVLQAEGSEAADYTTAHDRGPRPQTRSLEEQLRMIAMGMRDLPGILGAVDANVSVSARNSRRSLHETHWPLWKFKSGHGLGLAQAAAQSLHPGVLAGIVAPLEPPATGTLPPEFNSNIFDYQHRDILNMMMFYNDGFGVVPDDTLECRVEKFHQFLCQFY